MVLKILISIILFLIMVYFIISIFDFFVDLYKFIANKIAKKRVKKVNLNDN